ncbi:extracellular calcium-sensing receptor-like [Vombatus ursinus]|uniref:extracellular calcium-sensing receptor-like n=1 Tax=Vombatus ursinus TaxID=29139 RepID=UPI000FFD9C31|nr:extracellular calcium-sensing receptor-like [Vombatus ursinus]
MLFAVEEANRDPSFLPNVTVGFQLYDSCVSWTQALGSILGLLSGQLLPTPNFDCYPQHRLLGIIGGMTSPESVAMAELLSVYKVPQISHGSQHPQFSDRHRFPSFLRTVPSRAHQPQAIAKILLYFNWTWVGLVGSDSGAFEWLDLEFQKEVGKNGGCVSFSKKIDDHVNNVGDVADAIQASTAKVIVCDCYHIHFIILAKTLQEKNVTNRIWFLSTSFLLNPSILSREAREMLNGSLSLGIHSGSVPGLEHFLSTLRPAKYLDNHLIKLFWQELLGCTWPGLKPGGPRAGYVSPNCTGLEQLTPTHLSVLNLDDLTAAYQAYLAAKAFLVAYQNLRACSPGQGPFTGSNCAGTGDARSWQLLQHLRSVHFTTQAQEEIFFQDDEIPAIFDVVSIYLAPDHTLRTTEVGHLDFREPPGKQLVINSSTIIWAEGPGKAPLSVCSKTCPSGTRKSAIQGQPNCCFQCLHCPKGEIAYVPDSASCLKCPEDQWPSNEKDQCIPKILDFLSYKEPLGMALATCTTFLFLLALTILGIFIWHHHTPIVRANNQKLSYILLCSLALCFLCPFMFIGHPVSLTCALRQAAFGIIFTVCVSTTLAKTIVVVSAFRATRPDVRLRKWAGPSLPNVILIGCSLVQVVLCMCWVIGWPPVPMNSTEPGPKVTMLCGAGSSELFYAMLSYLGFLALVSLVVAFLARQLPDTFNEAKHITLSMLVFSCVWISFIPAHLSTQGKDTVAVEIFAILASGAGLMVCLFFPKCYIILLQPDKNTRDQMIGKRHFKK